MRKRRDSPERRHAMGSVNRRRRARLATETRHARVEDPGQHECRRQAKRCRYDHGAHRPLGEPEFRHDAVSRPEPHTRPRPRTTLRCGTPVAARSSLISCIGVAVEIPAC